ncbi:UPF0481 protein At3g47200-like [Silene latifolia]|uniref:UPF0481 protein At3g47200-like n=1 Tax=Silene latifolia TaxID=37657 RepID=UPI003D774499
MKLKLKTAQEYAANQPWQNWSIYRVPRRLREAQDNKVYVTQTVSIGPYHPTDEQLQSMDRHKWIALSRTLEHSGQDLDVYLDAIKRVEKQARACFQEDISHLSSNEFVEMMVLDGCFILELFHCSPKTENAHDLEAVIYNRTMIDDILLDLVMLENQIPLSILDRLLEIISNNQPNYRAVDLALNLFNAEWLTDTPISATELGDLKSSLGN